MYTLIPLEQTGYGGLLLMSALIIFVIRFLTVTGYEFYPGEDTSGHYRAFYIGTGIVVVITAALCFYASNMKYENRPYSATYISHTAVPGSNLFRTTYRLENGDIVQAEPYSVVKQHEGPITLYWNKSQ